MINESNESFTLTLGNLLRENNFRDMKYIYESLKKEYGLVAKRNEIASYNNSRIYYNNPK